MTESAAFREAASTAAGKRPTGRRRGDRIVGAGRATQQVVEAVLTAARTPLPVLVTGAAGTGKEHVARAIHAWGSHAAGPFLVVSCAAVPHDLLGRELFGCAAGIHASLPSAYQGAISRATDGTLLLDGADRLTEDVRRALARAVVDSEFSPEGAERAMPLRARIIAKSLDTAPPSPFGSASHHKIHLLPLSEREEDVLPLAAHFLRLYAEELGVPPVGFTADARSALVTEPWRGNVRELAERIRQAIKLAGNGALSAESLILATDGDSVPSFKEAKRAFETRYVIGLLRRCGGNISRAARLAKKDRKDFYDVIRRTGVNPSEFR